MNITIVIPTYNEAENLRSLVPAIQDLNTPGLQLLIVDDNSTDGTGKLADYFAASYANVSVLHRPGKLGLGTAYVQGFSLAMQRGADALIQMDADFSHPIEKVPELIQQLSHYDMVIGSRYVPGGSVDVNWPQWRKALSAWGNFYARSILRMKVRDLTGGFRIYKRQVLEAIPFQQVRSNGYVFQVEMAYITHRCGFRIGEIPIYFAERTWGDSKMSLKIQVEAAARTWQLPWLYRALKKNRG